MKRILLFFLGVLCAQPLHALADSALRLPAVISDHMVLQSGVPVPIWGWASAGTQVTVSFAGQSKSTQAEKDGKWMLRLDPLRADSKPGVLKVSSDSTLEVTDVLVGEVWLASGQSNMTLNVAQSSGGRAELAAADLPEIRLFTVESEGSWTAEEDCKGAWVLCTPKTAAPFSAVAFYFGREIRNALHVPVGMIHSSVKGSLIQAWTSQEAIEPVPEFKGFLQRFNIADKTRVPRKNQSTGLFNGKISPLVPYAIRGAIWYQGESNADGERALLYQKQLATLISDWRSHWGYDFPFGFVQLPDFGGTKRNWPLIREAQLNSLSIPNTGMAIAMGLGEEKNLHPKRKKEVGERLSLWALGSVYGLPVPSTSGPLPTAHEVRGNSMVVTFSHADQGLTGKDGALRGFELADSNHQWHPAEAKIDGDHVIVSSDAVPAPVALRYAWANDPDCNLYNGAGLPASPFRTDDWIETSSSPAAESDGDSQ